MERLHSREHGPVYEFTPVESKYTGIKDDEGNAPRYVQATPEIVRGLYRTATLLHEAGNPMVRTFAAELDTLIAPDMPEMGDEVDNFLNSFES